jgi:ribosomal protein S18 acetylase RimI-like enzyme
LVNVRECTRRDLEAVSELAERFTSFDTTPTLADIRGMHARNPEYFFVADDDRGWVIGFITGYERQGIPKEVLRTWNAKRVGYIELMAVDPSHRRMGAGRALMNAILDEFRRNHVDIVNLDVPSEQEAAIGLYRALGFSVRAYNMRIRLT